LNSRKRTQTAIFIESILGKKWREKLDGDDWKLVDQPADPVSNPGADPTILVYNGSAVKSCRAIYTLVHFFEKFSTLNKL
jgi:hypothetical protein